MKSMNGAKGIWKNMKKHKTILRLIRISFSVIIIIIKTIFKEKVSSVVKRNRINFHKSFHQKNKIHNIICILRKSSSQVATTNHIIIIYLHR